MTGRNPLPTAPDTVSAVASFRITHPFHPWFDQEFHAIECRRSWREDKVFFRDPNGRSTSLPITWTSLAVPDPFLVVSNRKARFRPRDLLELADLINRLRQTALAFGADRHQGPPREGPALLQGRVICGLCGSRMSARYRSYSRRIVTEYRLLSRPSAG